MEDNKGEEAPVAPSVSYFMNVFMYISLLDFEFLEIKDCVLLICISLVPGLDCI